MGKGQGAAGSSGTRAAALPCSSRSPGGIWGAGKMGRRLGFGPVGALGIFFFNNFAEPKKIIEKINKNPKMPKQIFTV